MPTIRNKLNKKLLIKLSSGKAIELLANGTAEVSDKDAKSPAVQSFLSKGHIDLL